MLSLSTQVYQHIYHALQAGDMQLQQARDCYNSGNCEQQRCWRAIHESRAYESEQLTSLKELYQAETNEIRSEHTKFCAGERMSLEKFSYVLDCCSSSNAYRSKIQDSLAKRREDDYALVSGTFKRRPICDSGETHEDTPKKIKVCSD